MHSPPPLPPSHKCNATTGVYHPLIKYSCTKVTFRGGGGVTVPSESCCKKSKNFFHSHVPSIKQQLLCFAGCLSECTASHTAPNNTPCGAFSYCVYIHLGLIVSTCIVGQNIYVQIWCFYHIWTYSLPNVLPHTPIG